MQSSDDETTIESLLPVRISNASLSGSSTNAVWSAVGFGLPELPEISKAERDHQRRPVVSGNGDSGPFEKAGRRRTGNRHIRLCHPSQLPDVPSCVATSEARIERDIDGIQHFTLPQGLFAPDRG